MSKRVANLIESIMGSAAAAQSVAETAKSTYAPSMPQGTALAKPGSEGPSALEESAKSVISQALKQSKAKKK